MDGDHFFRVDGDHFFSDLVSDVVGLTQDYVNAGGLRVSVKTNLGPEVPIFSGQGEGGFAQLIGIEAGVVVRDRDGNVITTYGDPPPTDYVKAAILASAALGLVIVLVRGLRGL